MLSTQRLSCQGFRSNRSSGIRADFEQPERLERCSELIPTKGKWASNELILKDAFTTLKGRARIKRTMWSRRAQEYEAKINSGDLILVSEVVRDLHRTDEQPEQSYSERQLYESAIDRMVREVAAINKTSRDVALSDVLETLTVARNRQAAKAAKEAEAKAAEEGEDEEAA